MSDNALRTGTPRIDAREDESTRGKPFPNSLSAIAFWSAIGLPALYIPLIVAGLGSLGDLAAFLGLFGLHLVALLAGQSYRTGE